LVEQRIENPRVAGSIPALGTILISVKSSGCGVLRERMDSHVVLTKLSPRK
jgi:hypothetical protein